MNRRQIIILSLVLVCIIAVMFKTLLKFDSSESWDALKETPDRYEIVSRSGKIEIANISGNWMILSSNFPADEEAANAMRDVLTNKRSFELISEQPLDMDYELDDAMKLSLTAYSKNKIIREVLIGGYTANSGESWVRLKDSKAVYATEGNLKSIFGKPLADLRSKVIIKIAAEKLIAFSIERGGKKLTAIRTNAVIPMTDTNQPAQTLAVWKDDKGRILKDAEVNDLINTLCAFNAAGFSTEDLDTLKKEKPLVKLTAVSTEGSQSVTLLRKAADGNWRAWSEGRESGLLVADWQAKRFDIDTETLVQK